MSKPTEVSADDERFLGGLFKVGMNLLNRHQSIRDKLFGMLSSREISPDQEREISAMAEELKADVMEESRDVSLEDVSPEDQQRWLGAAIGLASTAWRIHKAHPGIAKTGVGLFKKIFF